MGALVGVVTIVAAAMEGAAARAVRAAVAIPPTSATPPKARIYLLNSVNRDAVLIDDALSLPLLTLASCRVCFVFRVTLVLERLRNILLFALNIFYLYMWIFLVKYCMCVCVCVCVCLLVCFFFQRYMLM